MDDWSDQGIVLKARAYGEAGSIVTMLTENHGRHAGYLRGGQSSRLRAVVQPGTLAAARWASRVDDQLGNWTLEADRQYSGTIIDDPLRLSALLSACALCDAALPERETHPGLFHGLHALLEALATSEVWGAAYVIWEVALLRELGFRLDLGRCVAGGSGDLVYVSPKSGGAVSREKGEAYKDKLLMLPDFLKAVRSGGDDADVATGLKLTGHFLEHWAFIHHAKGMPEQRKDFQARFEASLPGTSP